MTSIHSASGPSGGAGPRNASSLLGSRVRLALPAHHVGERPSGPEIPAMAVLGRSNVGKSSLLNALLGVKVARVSQTPGRTQALYWYRVDERYHLVDCPGYGYAKTAKVKREQFSEMIETLLSQEPKPAALLLVDGRLEPQESDRSMSLFLTELQLPSIVVFTKWDAVKPSVRVRRLRALREAYGDVEPEAGAVVGGARTPLQRALLPVSSETGENLRELARLMAERLTPAVPAASANPTTNSQPQKENP